MNSKELCDIMDAIYADHTNKREEAKRAKEAQEEEAKRAKQAQDE